MLDMGFINDIRKIVAKLPIKRQTLFFSATMPKDIAELAEAMLRDPARVAVTPAATTVERITQRIIQVDHAAKPALLAQLLKQEPVDRALIFTRTKHGADKVVKGLAKAGISGRRHPRQQVAEPPRARAGRLPHRRNPHAGRHRHRRPRHRRRRHQPCRQFRPAQRARDLCPPHRPHRAGRRRGHRDLAGRGRRGDGVSARHRTADPHRAAARGPPYAGPAATPRPHKASTAPAARRRARMPHARMTVRRPRKVLAAAAAVVVKRESPQSTDRSRTARRMAAARRRDSTASLFCIAKPAPHSAPTATNSRPSRQSIWRNPWLKKS